MIRQGLKTTPFCPDCGLASRGHIQSWLDELANHLLPAAFLHPLMRRAEQYLDRWLEKFFLLTRLARLREDFLPHDIQLRSACFIEEARRQGFGFKILEGPFGYTPHIRMYTPKKKDAFRFETLPTAARQSRYALELIDDKALTKKRLAGEGFPVAEGKSFWFWQASKAIHFGINTLGFPLVVKPRSGSFSHHVKTDINDAETLRAAVKSVLSYSPTFLVEKFSPNAFVFRATVVDFDSVFCVKQVPAHVVADGTHSIRELVYIKNNDPRRSKAGEKGRVLYPIVTNETTHVLLANRHYDYDTIAPKGEMVWLQKDPFLKLGGDLVEVTPTVHPENSRLFKQVARFFDVRLVGIDFIARDVTTAWHAQRSAILELNSVPCIELHHFPSHGTPQNVARALVAMTLKYYR